MNEVGSVFWGVPCSKKILLITRISPHARVSHFNIDPVAGLKIYDKY